MKIIRKMTQGVPVMLLTGPDVIQIAECEANSYR